MKSRVVSLSLIASHPFQSFAVDDYMAEPEHIKNLMLERTPNSYARINWMLDNNIVTADQIRQYAQEMIDAEKLIAYKKMARIADALAALDLPKADD